MSERPQLTATPRQVGRKALLTALRRDGKVPAVLYGHGDPQPIAIDQHEVEQFLRRHAPSVLLDLAVAGDATTAMIKQVELHPISGRPRHLDLQRVSLSDTVTTHVPLVFDGIEEMQRAGAVPTFQISELAISCRADHLPEAIHVDVSHLGPGELIRIGDLLIPE